MTLNLDSMKTGLRKFKADFVTQSSDDEELVRHVEVSLMSIDHCSKLLEGCALKSGPQIRVIISGVKEIFKNSAAKVLTVFKKASGAKIDFFSNSRFEPNKKDKENLESLKVGKMGRIENLRGGSYNDATLDLSQNFKAISVSNPYTTRGYSKE